MFVRTKADEEEGVCPMTKFHRTALDHKGFRKWCVGIRFGAWDLSQAKYEVTIRDANTATVLVTNINAKMDPPRVSAAAFDVNVPAAWPAYQAFTSSKNKRLQEDSVGHYALLEDSD